jgi:hypothetical protein
MRVQNGIVLTMEGAPIPCGYVDFENGKIFYCNLYNSRTFLCVRLPYGR